ncbi:alpha/beta fold hydrolase [Streptomyces sp. NPDC050504]|uniref:alpha/beta fold hydrolase n=1 Tax=Streptomyces sp. NPDC050504 TaxID=3365618 RepID=UPI003788EA3B
MRLHTHTWGTGDRVALLVHGIMADHRTWRRVGPALADLGYRAVAVDLRGHGASARGERADYVPERLADDLVDTFPDGVEVAFGHSLGGLALSLAVERLAPQRAVYVDPAWRLALGEGVSVDMFAEFKHATRGNIRMLNPRWDEEDVDIEVATLAAWDEESARALTPYSDRDLAPASPAVKSLVVLADPSTLVPARAAADLVERGFEVRTVKGAGHTIQRDDFDGFMASLDGWV